jgi:hypothetical protein
VIDLTPQAAAVALAARRGVEDEFSLSCRTEEDPEEDSEMSPVFIRHVGFGEREARRQHNFVPAGRIEAEGG